MPQIGYSSTNNIRCIGQISQYSDDNDPSNNCILFSDWETNPRSVAEMSHKKLPRVELAYISACHGANNLDMELLDESIHIAGACQLAEFPMVIGTMWQIGDMISEVIAKDVYRAILTGDKLEI